MATAMVRLTARVEELADRNEKEHKDFEYADDTIMEVSSKINSGMRDLFVEYRKYYDATEIGFNRRLMRLERPWWRKLLRMGVKNPPPLEAGDGAPIRAAKETGRS